MEEKGRGHGCAWATTAHPPQRQPLQFPPSTHTGRVVLRKGRSAHRGSPQFPLRQSQHLPSPSPKERRRTMAGKLVPSLPPPQEGTCPQRSGDSPCPGGDPLVPPFPALPRGASSPGKPRLLGLCQQPPPPPGPSHRGMVAKGEELYCLNIRQYPGNKVPGYPRRRPHGGTVAEQEQVHIPSLTGADAGCWGGLIPGVFGVFQPNLPSYRPSG